MAQAHVSIQHAIRTFVAGRRTRHEHPEMVASDVVAALWTSMNALIESQPDTFADLGQTYLERIDLAKKLAASLYTSGLQDLSAKRLHTLVLQEEVQLLIVDYLCQRPYALVIDHLLDRLLKRAEYAAYVGTTTTPTGSIIPIGHPSGPNSVLPEVPSTLGNRGTRRGAPRVGVQRDTRRTPQCDTGPMPAIRVPARVRSSDPQTDSPVSPSLVTRRSRNGLRKTSLIPLSPSPPPALSKGDPK